MGVSNVTPEMANFQIQNMKNQLDMIKLQTQNIFLLPTILPMSGMEIINQGIQVLKICVELSNMGIGIDQQSNYLLQIQNIGKQLLSMGSQLQNYMPCLNNGMQMQDYAQHSNNFMNNQNMMNFQSSPNCNNYLFTPKKSIIFETKAGDRISLTFPYGTTIDKVIQKYLEIKQNFNYNNTLFVYNAKVINKDDKTKIEELFKHGDVPRVLVYEDMLLAG